jgi:hypothetical protein
MKNGRLTIKNRLKRLNFTDFCRYNLYPIGLANFLVLVNNTKFPNFKEEINV